MRQALTLNSFRHAERQLEIAALRALAEFSAFTGIIADLGETALAFEVAPDGIVTFGDTPPALQGFYLRHALELSYLMRKPGVTTARAGLAAARTAALFIMAEDTAAAKLPFWVAEMAAEVAPSAMQLTKIWTVLAPLQLGATTVLPAADAAQIRKIWGHLGTVESLMETGGDIRLQRDPVTALNGYGCSHRARPWAITFASSTASSSSERGYVAADRVRLQTTAKLLCGELRRPVAAALHAVRRGLSREIGLQKGTAIVLAASGTDTELLALALTHLAVPALPILNILIASEETGRGVPMAARGLHFAVDTALGHDVTFEAPIAGFRADTRLANVALRHPSGALRTAAAVEAELRTTVAIGINAGQRVMLHVLDLSKTGLLAPGFACLRDLRAQHGDRLDIVVDACQSRLSSASIRAYLALGAVVLITGSKFFTGPPFAGAALLPAGIAARFAHRALPAGLDAYFGRDEFPATCRAAAALPPLGNYGLALRWHAALAEINAVGRISTARRLQILQGFGEVVRAEISANAALDLLDVPPITRHDTDDAWERQQTIFTFMLRSPVQQRKYLTPEDARKLYLWLNADLSSLIAAAAARRICHIGQPVKLPQPDGEGFMGVLRISAGARLISGEPSHRFMGHQARIEREFADLRTVFEKIGLILQHWHLLNAANPAPRYRLPVPA